MCGPELSRGMMTSQSPIRARGLSKRYGGRTPRDTWALRELNLEVPQGSITALVGPNGAGKTTLMKVCTAFERPTAGSVEVDGVDPWKQRGRALDGIGYVPQKPALYRGLTVKEHLDLARTYRPNFDVSYARGRLEQLDIPLQQRADTLSGGQGAQLGLAIALGTRARVLLLDEPLANLDPLARRDFIQVLIEAIRHDGSTALISSHIITDVEEGCDRLAIIGRGKLLLDGSLVQARADHRVTLSGTACSNAIEVGMFNGRDSRSLTLWRVKTGSTSEECAPTETSEPAALEDVVLGYLAAGRPRQQVQESAEAMR
jgi:ABC-2 type transport system ATP-binding protein